MFTTDATPRLDFSLPGIWVQCPVGDVAREEALLGILRAGVPNGHRLAVQARVQMDRLRGVGGSQIFLRQDQETSTLLTLTWPRSLPSPAVFAGGEAAIDSLRVEAGGDAAKVKSQRGFWVVRAERSDQDSESSTYWVAHPISARTLVIDVTVYRRDRSELAIYDAVVGALSWMDEDPLR